MVRLVLFTTTFLIPFYFIRFQILGVPTNLFEVSVFLLLAVCIIRLSRQRKGTLAISDDTKFLRSFTVYAAMLLFSALIGSWQVGFSADSLGIIKSWLVVPIVFGGVVGYRLLTAKRDKERASSLNPMIPKLKPVLFGLYASMLVVSVWAILQKLGVVSTMFYQSGDPSFSQYLGANFRAFGPFESPNYLSMYLVPAAFLALGLGQLINKKQRNLSLFFYFSFVLPLLAVIFSESRAGLIALVLSAVIAFSIWLYQSLRSKTSRILLVAVSGLLGLVLLFLVLRYGLRGSDEIRIEIYSNAWRMVKENWLWGIGLGNFQNYLSAMPITEAFRTNALSYAYHPHNLYLALWLNFGLLGLLSFVAIVATSAINLLRSFDLFSLFILAALSAILIHGLFDTTYFKNDLSVLFWLVVFLSNFRGRSPANRPN